MDFQKLNGQTLGACNVDIETTNASIRDIQGYPYVDALCLRCLYILSKWNPHPICNPCKIKFKDYLTREAEANGLKGDELVKYVDDLFEKIMWECRRPVDPLYLRMNNGVL